MFSRDPAGQSQTKAIAAKPGDSYGRDPPEYGHHRSQSSHRGLKEIDAQKYSSQEFLWPLQNFSYDLGLGIIGMYEVLEAKPLHADKSCLSAAKEGCRY